MEARGPRQGYNVGGRAQQTSRRNASEREVFEVMQEAAAHSSHLARTLACRPDAPFLRSRYVQPLARVLTTAG